MNKSTCISRLLEDAKPCNQVFLQFPTRPLHKEAGRLRRVEWHIRLKHSKSTTNKGGLLNMAGGRGWVGGVTDGPYFLFQKGPVRRMTSKRKQHSRISLNTLNRHILAY